MKYASALSYPQKLAAAFTYLCAAGVLGLLVTLPAAGANPQAALLSTPVTADSRRTAERTDYKLALQDLAQNRLTDFKQKQKRLRNYPLAPYLEYHLLSQQIDSLSSRQVADFRARFADYPFTERLRDRWLLRLPAQGRWTDYLANYEPSSSVTRQCYHLRALYRSGQRKAALDQVAPLWTQGKSQPKACDSLFRTWIGAGYLGDQLVWERLTLALDNNEVTLANYLLKLIKSVELKDQANALYQAHVRPETKFNPDAHREDTSTNRAILSVGLKRLARKDPEAALALWQKLRTSHDFSPAVRSSIESRLWVEAAQDQIYPAAADQPVDLSDSALQLIAREAVRQQNWPQANHWIGQMSPQQRSEPEWTYWYNRSAGRGLAELASERNYYGFLAARDEGVDTRLNHEPSDVPVATREAVSNRPGIERALELYAVDDLINARREWQAAFATLSADQQAAAAQLAHQHGWLDQAIIAANAARLDNDLDLRFPQVFANIYGMASDATKIAPSTLLAVTRQESAFAQRAHSSADARGLMQLLPATARRAAKQAGLRPPSTLDLYEPAINIRIASEYLASLMLRYNQQRPLAFAAYNAGERRVDRWIKDRTGMPMEVWIETIPFSETRGYVKSVLAFNHLYSKRLNDPMPLLLPHERTVN